MFNPPNPDAAEEIKSLCCSIGALFAREEIDNDTAATVLVHTLGFVICQMSLIDLDVVYDEFKEGLKIVVEKTRLLNDVN